MSERAKVTVVARLLVEHDWPGLIKWAKAHDCLPDRYGADNPAEYEWKGDHEEDARHTCPARSRLIDACLQAALDQSRRQGGP